MVNIDVKDENAELSTTSNTTNPSEKRLEKALNYIEDFLTEQNAQLKSQDKFKNKDVVLANLDMLILRMQEVLQQFDQAE